MALFSETNVTKMALNLMQLYSKSDFFRAVQKRICNGLTQAVVNLKINLGGVLQ